MEMPSNEILLKLYRELLTARRGEQRMFEITGSRIFPAGHRGPGEEVIPIALCNNLTETDCFIQIFEPHSVCLPNQDSH
jgi:TPP-dependent pyruvate/acetoin dehydrogenase alpha subunit